MKVLFLQLAHPETDDRIVHQMMTLRAHGYACAFARERTKDDAADVIICDTPKAVLRNIGYSGVVVYDVTEWYPSKKNLRPFTPLLRPFAAAVMGCLSLLAGCVASRFIFGEEDKSKPFRWLFPWKKYVFLPYYPSKSLFAGGDIQREQNSPLRVLYAGPLTEEKGYFRAMNVAKQAGVELTVIGPDQYMPLEEFCRYIQNFDIALDLRDRDVENRKCLPIKLFYYWAAGVVPIYTDLDAIRKHIPNVDEAAFLVRDENEAIRVLKNIMQDHVLFQQYSRNGRKLFRKGYNWESIDDCLLTVIGDGNEYKV